MTKKESQKEKVKKIKTTDKQETLNKIIAGMNEKGYVFDRIEPMDNYLKLMVFKKTEEDTSDSNE